MLKQKKKTGKCQKRTAKLRVGYLKKINKIDNSLAGLKKNRRLENKK